MTKQGQLNKLKRENEAFRDELERLVPVKNRKDVKELLGWIIENEFEQEELCNE